MASAAPLRRLLVAAAGVALYFAMESAAGTSMIGAFGVVWPLVIMAIGLMLLGVPIVDALIFGTFVAFLPQGELALLPVPQGMVNSLDYLLLAIPFFMLAAGMMNVGGITEKLIALATTLVGHFRGGLGHVNVLTNTLMGGVSGSSTADAAAIAKTMVPAMERRGYPKPFGVALTSAASILANMIPPSLGLIIFGALASVSVGALFVATIVPGLLMALAMSIVVHFECIRRGIGERGERSSWGTRGAALQVRAAGAGAAGHHRRRHPLRRVLGDRSRRGRGALCGAVRRFHLSRRERRDPAACVARERGRDRDRAGGDRGVRAVCVCADHRAGAAETRRRDGDADGRAGFCCCSCSTCSCCSSGSRWR